MSKQTYFYAVSAIMILVAALHLARALNGWELELGTVVLPIWLSWVVVVLLGYLAIVGFKFGRKM